jgi:hypothetical protein
MDTTLQLIGAVLILAGFILAQLKVLDTDTLVYLVLNLIGSALLGVLAYLDEDWGFLLLEGVWAIVSAWALVALLRGRASAPAH